MGNGPTSIDAFKADGPFMSAVAEMARDLNVRLDLIDAGAIVDSYRLHVERGVLPNTSEEQQLAETVIRYANSLIKTPEDVPDDFDYWLSDIDNLPEGSLPRIRLTLAYEYIKLSGSLADENAASKAGNVANAIENNRFNPYQLSILETVSHLLGNPEKTAIAQNLLSLIEFGSELEPSFPYGFDVLVRKADEMSMPEIRAWRRRLEWTLARTSISSGFFSQRILGLLVRSNSDESLNLQSVYQSLFRNNIGRSLRFARRTAESWNLQLKLSGLRYQSMLVLLQYGRTEIVGRYLDVLKAWGGSVHGIVDVFIHAAAATVPTGDDERMAHIMDMLEIIEGQAEAVKYLEEGAWNNIGELGETLDEMKRQTNEIQNYDGVAGDERGLFEELRTAAEHQMRPIARYVDRLQVLDLARTSWFEMNPARSFVNEFQRKLLQLFGISGGENRLRIRSAQSEAITAANEGAITGIETITAYHDEDDAGDEEPAADSGGNWADVYASEVAPADAWNMSVFEASLVY